MIEHQRTFKTGHMCKNFYLGLATSLFSLLLHGQTLDFEWAKATGGSTFNDRGESIVEDGLGNIYSTGTFYGTVDFDPGPATFNMTSQGSDDIYIQKLDTAGNFVWAKSVGGVTLDRGSSITIDAFGNIYVTGLFRATADFDPGPATFNITSNGIYDIFILKLTSSGNFVWAKSIGGVSSEVVADMVADASGNLYLTGSFANTVDFDPGPSVFNMGSFLTDVFVLKLGAAGNFIWAKGFGGTNIDNGASIALDANNDLLITGSFRGLGDFDPTIGTFYITSNGQTDGFISKFDASGNFIWAKAMGGTSYDNGTAIITDPANNIYTVGVFRDTVDFDPGVSTFNLISNGSNDVFVQKLDASGNFIWAKSFGGNNFDNGHEVVMDQAGNLFITGLYTNTVDFDPGVGTFNLTAVGGNDIFVEKLDANGEFVWAGSMGSSGADQGNSIAVDSWGDIYTTGYFDGTTDFDPGAATFNLSPKGDDDAFVQKLGQCLESSNDTIMACDSHTWIDGNTYTASNFTATHRLTTIGGCDSIIRLKLTVNYSNTGIDVQTACDTYTWIDGNTYTSSNNTATHTLTNATGCDSVVTLDLMVNSSNTGTDVQTACDTYTWIDGNTYTSNNNSATHTLTNTAGCDSVVTLDLTVNYSTTGTDVQTACDTYTWIDGNTYTSSNNTATHTLANATGCDSVVTLNLTVNHSNTGTDIQVACDTYTWIDGNTYTASNNTATHTLINATGCDSVVTLDLTVNYATAGVDVQTACDSLTWIDGNTYTSNNNTATHTLVNAAGCDSVITLNFSITTVDVTISANGNEITANAGGDSYQWLDCDNNYTSISGATSQTFTALSNGNYAVEITKTGCTDTSECIAITTIGLIEADVNEITIFPNPTTGLVQLDLGNLQDVSVKVVDLTGKQVYRKDHLNKKMHQFELQAKAGIYILEISSLGAKQQYKIVKQ